MLWERIFRPRAAAPEPDVPAVAATHPTGYAEEIELALIATVLGADGAVGEPSPDPIAVRVVVDRWHRHRGCQPADSLPHVSGLDDHAFARILQDQSTLGGRPRSCVVQDAADALVGAGIEHSGDLRADPATARSRLVGVRGLEAAAVERLCALLGVGVDGAAASRSATPVVEER